jgi:hypothetical protein
MKKETVNGAEEFCKMFAVYISKMRDRRIAHFSEPWNGGIRMVFRVDLYQLFTFYLNEEEKKILLFSNLKNMYPVLHSNLLIFSLSSDLSLKTNQNKMRFPF